MVDILSTWTKILFDILLINICPFYLLYKNIQLIFIDCSFY